MMEAASVWETIESEAKITHWPHHEAHVCWVRPLLPPRRPPLDYKDSKVAGIFANLRVDDVLPPHPEDAQASVGQQLLKCSAHQVLIRLHKDQRRA